MATNKNAQLRYNALDKCFSNPYKKHYIEELISYCSEILSEHYAKETSVSRRQIFDDMNFMRSEAGFDAPIESYKDGRKVYYRYSEKEFSIQKSPINPAEMDSLQQALATLGRISSLPGFDWVASLQAKLHSGIEKETQNKQIIDFEENEFLKGLEHLNSLFHYIANQQTLDITYQSFKSKNKNTFVLSPYYLKQYNNRWFLFGWNHQFGNIQNLALDRIQNIKHIKETYFASVIDFEQYFEDIIGVSNPLEKATEKIQILLSDNIIPYITSKPIHGSQRIKENTLHIEVKINYELESLLLSYGENMSVLWPESLRDKMRIRVESLLKNY